MLSDGVMTKYYLEDMTPMTYTDPGDHLDAERNFQTCRAEFAEWGIGHDMLAEVLGVNGEFRI